MEDGPTSDGSPDAQSTQDTRPAFDASGVHDASLPADTSTQPTPSEQWERADLDCQPANNPSVMPATAREYADLCAEHGLGVPPTVRCEDAVRVPTTIDGEEVFESPRACDHTSMLKPACHVGSRIARVQGRDADGTPLPEVVWTYFCRAAENTADSSVQMIGYHYETGATCFSKPMKGRTASYLTDWVEMSSTGSRERCRHTKMRTSTESLFQHRGSAFSAIRTIHLFGTRLDGARLPDNPDEPVLPTLDAQSPYYRGWLQLGHAHHSHRGKRLPLLSSHRNGG